MQTKHDLQISSAHNDFIESLEELYQSGLGYERGDGLQKSLKSAFECYQLAAVQDHQKAQIALAELDKNEIFEFSSYEKSFYCSESMSEQNNQKKLPSIFYIWTSRRPLELYYGYFSRRINFSISTSPNMDRDRNLLGSISLYSY